MRTLVAAVAGTLICVPLLYGMSSDESTPASTSESHGGGIPLERIIAAVSHKTGKKYLLDPRVNAQVQIIGQDVSTITYSDLLAILEVYGFVAVESGNYVRVLPNAAARQLGGSPISTGQAFPDAQFVTTVIQVKNISAAQLVPILRPLMPQYGHLAAYPCTNALLMADSFSNVKRIEALVKALDVGTPYKTTNCDSWTGGHTDTPAAKGPG